MLGGLVSVTRLPHRQSSRYDVPERAPAIATKRELRAQQPWAYARPDVTSLTVLQLAGEYARREFARSHFTGTGMDRGDLGRDASHGVRERQSSANAGIGRWLTCPGDLARSGNGNTSTSRTAPSSAARAPGVPRRSRRAR